MFKNRMTAFHERLNNAGIDVALITDDDNSGCSSRWA